MDNIVIIAHNTKKPDMVRFLQEHKDWIPEVNLIATGYTAEFVEKEGIKVKHLSPGQTGGYLEIHQMLHRREVDMVLFFMDPTVKKHHNDIEMLIDLCNTDNIPIATNPVSAELMILGLIRQKVALRSKGIFKTED